MSLRGQVLRLAWGGMGVSLLGTGLGTAVVLHKRAIAAGDATLIAAAAAFARAPGGDVWLGEGAPTPVDVHWGDPTADIHGSRAVIDEDPVFVDDGDTRVLYFPIEAPDAHSNPDHEHALVIASQPRVELHDSIGPFLIAFGLVVGSVAALVGSLQATLLSRALAPLPRAGADLRRVTAAGMGQRMVEEGPEEVRMLLVEVNLLLTRLDAAFSAQSRFAARAAHELRTPVAVLRGELELAMRRPRTAEEWREIASRSLDAVDRLARLVDALMALARVDAGQVERARVPERASEVLLRALERELPWTEPAVDVDGDAEVLAHPTLLDAAVGNLLRNALLHAPPGPDNVRLERVGDRLRFVVEDRGPGLTAAERREVFARGDDGSGGLGLGLPLAREVARRHGGDCWVEDRPGGGCRAILEVAVAEP